MEKKTLVRGLTYLTASNLIQEPSESDIDFWFSLVEEYSDDVYHEAIVEMVKKTTEAFPGTNIIAKVIEKMDRIESDRATRIELDKAEEHRKARKLLADEQAKQCLIEASEAEKRLLTPEYQENLRKMDGDFGKYIKDMTVSSMAHCDKFIDETRKPIDLADFKKPWDQERIELVRKKLKAKTLAGK